MFERNGALLERKFREFLLPTLLTTAALSLATVISSIIVGNLLGEQALSAIGLTSPVIYALNALFLMFAAGGVTLASVARGQRDERRANTLFTLTMVVGIALMLLLVVILRLLMRPICHALAQGNAELEALTFAYLNPIVLVGPAMMLIMGMAQFVRADGSPKFSATIAIVANSVNLVLAYVFIQFFHTGIAGAAWAIVIGYLAGIFMLLPYLFSKTRGFRLIKPTAPVIETVGNIAFTGMPKALTQGLGFFANLIMNLIILNTLGPNGLAAMMICLNALIFAKIFIGGTDDTLLPIVGVLFGEKDYSGIRYALKAAVKLLVVAVILIMVAFFLFPAEVCRLFGVTSPDGIAVATGALRLYALSLPLYGLNILLQNFYQTTRRSGIATTIVCCNGLGFVALYAVILSQINPNLVFLTYALSELSTFLVVLVMGWCVRRREGVRGILLLNESDRTETRLDLSIPATEQAAVAVSQQMIDFCAEHVTDVRLSGHVGMVVEEMAVNIARYGHKRRTGTIDVLLLCEKDVLIVRMRDDGIPFDPTAYQPEDNNELLLGGIKLTRKLADEITYVRPVGLNSTLITFRQDITAIVPD